MHSTHSLLPSHSALWGKRECALCIWASKIRPYQISTSYTLYTVGIVLPLVAPRHRGQGIKKMNSVVYSVEINHYSDTQPLLF